MTLLAIFIYAFFPSHRKQRNSVTSLA